MASDAAARLMSDVEVRLLGPEDASMLDRVAPDLFDHAIQPALTAEMLADPRHHLAVAVDDGVVIAFVSGVHYVHPDKRAQLFINEVATAPTHRRRGIARAMLACMLDRGRALGCTEAWVLTERENTAAMALYTEHAGEPADAVMFTLPLDLA